MGKQINQYVDTATGVEDGSFFDIDQEISPGVWQSQKVPKAVMQQALGVFYYVNGILSSPRDVTMDENYLQFLGSQTNFGMAETLFPSAGPAPVQNIDFNLGNTHKIDLQNVTDDLTLTFSDPLQGCIYSFHIVQGAQLGNVIWPAEVKWEAGQVLIPTPIIGAIDMVTMQYDGDKYLASFGTNFQ